MNAQLFTVEDVFEAFFLGVFFTITAGCLWYGLAKAGGSLVDWLIEVFERRRAARKAAE